MADMYAATRQGNSLGREQEDLKGRGHEGALRQRRVGLGHDECRILSFSLMTSKPQVWRFGTACWRSGGAMPSAYKRQGT